ILHRRESTSGKAWELATNFAALDRGINVRGSGLAGGWQKAGSLYHKPSQAQIHALTRSRHSAKIKAWVFRPIRRGVVARAWLSARVQGRQHDGGTFRLC
ncbi:hypothetical protein, partial [Syntrophothermus sp.]|uniref:hypothetical protein n=1 Tax=Syntrophothermus sp. TaxID=2736299 RepID=UPI00258087FC